MWIHIAVGPGKRLALFMVQMIQVVDAANKSAVSGARVVSKEEQQAVEDL